MGTRPQVKRMSSRQGIKKGAPLSPNLINLKSNTMKNTMQRYALFQ
jgi:hypothetical protein